MSLGDGLHATLLLAASFTLGGVGVLLGGEEHGHQRVLRGGEHSDHGLVDGILVDVGTFLGQISGTTTR